MVKTADELAKQDAEKLAAEAADDGSRCAHRRWQTAALSFTQLLVLDMVHLPCSCRYWADVARATIAAAERRAAEAEAKTAAAEARAIEAEAAERRAARTWHEEDHPAVDKSSGATRSAAATPSAAGNKDKGSPVRRLLEAVYARKKAASAATATSI